MLLSVTYLISLQSAKLDVFLQGLSRPLKSNIPSIDSLFLASHLFAMRSKSKLLQEAKKILRNKTSLVPYLLGILSSVRPTKKQMQINQFVYI